MSSADYREIVMNTPAEEDGNPFFLLMRQIKAYVFKARALGHSDIKIKIAVGLFVDQCLEMHNLWGNRLWMLRVADQALEEALADSRVA